MVWAMSAIGHLLKVARQYAEVEGISLSAVSWRLFADNKKLRALDEFGADIQVKRLEQAMRWLSANWPQGADWPADVPRPASEGAAA